MTPWEILSGDMDARVESDLGDSISVTFTDGSTETVLGFLTNNADAVGVGGINPIPVLWHLQIKKTRLPGGLESIRFIEHRLLQGRFRPAADTIDESGADYLFDLQRAR